MGKIKIKTLGTEDEEAAKKQAKEKREQKKLREKSFDKAQDKALKEKPVDENLERKVKKESVKEAFVEKKKEVKKEAKVEVSAEEPKPTKPQAEEKSAAPKKRSQDYRNALKLVDKTKLYPISQAIELVKQTSYSKFVGTVEVHINCLEKGLKVSVTLPFGTGKERRIVVVTDEVLADIAANKINFDALIATPDFMPKLARFAKVLGPRGLMPNPKAGTVTMTPDKVVAELKAGRIDLKTESDAPIIHTIIGKVDFDSKKLVDNLTKLIETIGKEKIRSVFIKATMGPSIKVAL